MSLTTNLVHWFPLKVDGADGIGSASPSVAGVTFTGTHADFTASPGSYIHWGNIFNVGTSNLTMAGWVYVNSYAGSGHQGAVFSKACSSLNAQTGNALYFFNSQSRAQVGSGGTSTIATAPLPSTGAWHHIVLTRDGTSIKQYIDGVLVDTQTSATVYNITSAASNTFLTCGAIRIPGAAFWYGGLDGSLNDLLAYERALSLPEIVTIYNAGQGGFSGLLQATAINMWGSLVHDAPPNYAVASNMWGSLVHDAPPNYAVASNMWGSMVHEAGAPQTTSVTNMWGSIVHNSPPNYAVAANMWGSIVHSAEPNYAVASNMWGTLVHSGSGSSPPGPTPIITGSNPTVNLIEANTTGYVINTYAINLLSVQRSREPEQVPFKLGTKGRQSLRLSTNTEFTGSS